MGITSWSIAELAGRVCVGEVSAREAAEGYLAAIRAREGEIGAYTTLCEEEALAAADAIDRRIAAGENPGPLAGVPLAIKDNICTHGVQTTCASRILAGFRPVYDATVVRRLREAGALVLGKTNMDEFGMGSTSENSCFHTTRNPHNTAYAPGGSSGGSAAAVAAGEALAALGTDTGGSVRVPAAWCGVVGLKPSYGAVSRYGLIAYASSLDQIGPIGRSVDDVRRVFEVICGQDPLDATSRPPVSEPIPQDAPRGWVVGVPTEFFGDDVQPEVAVRVGEAIEAFRAMGAEVREVSIPSVKHALAAYLALSCAEASSNLARFDGVQYGHAAEGAKTLDELYCQSRSEGFGPEVKRRLLLGSHVLNGGGELYKRARHVGSMLRQEFTAAFAGCQLLLAPACLTAAYRLGGVDDPDRAYQSDALTVPANLAELPALCLPCGKTAGGLPVGLQLMAPAFCEARLFAAGEAYEEVRG